MAETMALLVELPPMTAENDRKDAFKLPLPLPAPFAGNLTIAECIADIDTEARTIAQSDTIPNLDPDPDTGPEKDRHRWRPSIHAMPSHGWLNDPCAPGYDAFNRVYHLGFQWNPHDTEWANIAWGAATSTDLVHWAVADEPSMAPTATHDPCGVFTGCMLPMGPDGRVDGGLITALYTSARRLPIHYTLPHSPGSELLCMATSRDSGRTWQRDLSNAAVVPGPPARLDVVGWRDPFVGPWPAVDKLLGGARHTPALYGILSGGLRDASPTTFLYRVDPHCLDRWDYLGPLLRPGLHFAPSPRWAADFGVNWEVTNFLSLQEPGTGLSADFLICGVEGLKASPEAVRTKGDFRATHGQMWLCGEPRRRPADAEDPQGQDTLGVVDLVYQYGGVLDHGALYAANSFWDPVTQQHVVFGWVLEEDLPIDLRRRQGFAGALSFPRVLLLGSLRFVVGALVTPLRDIGTIGITPTDDTDDEPTSFTVTTLCVAPEPRLQQLRSRSGALSTDALLLARPGLWTASPLAQPCAQFELKVAFQASTCAQRLGFCILHSNEESTTVYFDPLAETVVVDRSVSTCTPGIATFDESAPHTLFTFARPENPDKDDASKVVLSREELCFHLYFDHGLVEVFVNERTVITTRVYPSTATCLTIEPFISPHTTIHVTDDSVSSELLSFDLWPLAL